MLDAKEFVDLALRPKPELIVHNGDLPATAEAVRDLLAASGKFFDRGVRKHRRATKIFYISDHDPAGHAMPASIARKLEFLLRRWRRRPRRPSDPAPLPGELPSWRLMLAACHARAHTLSPKDRAFVRSLGRWRGELSEKQMSWLVDLLERIAA